MQAGVGLLVADVMHIYMIMPRYSHNYALFYQLLDSNLFIYHNTYAILREATSETYGPRVYLPSYYFHINLLFLLPFILQSLFSNLYHKNTKNIYLIISIRSHSRKWPWRDYCVGCEILIVCVGAWDFWGASYWIDTLVLKKWGKYLCYYCCITLSSSRKNQRKLKT